MLYHIVPFIFVLGMIVFFHELGHFMVAKRSGMRVFEFALGFGPVVAAWESGGTTYSLRAVPVGGFVRIAGMEPGEDPNTEGSFNSKPFGARLLTLSAGCLMNFVLATLIYIGLGMFVGIPDGTVTNRVERVIPGERASVAGLRHGDSIVGVNELRATDVRKLREAIEKSPGKPLRLTVERNGKLIRLNVTPKPTREGSSTVGRIGIEFEATLVRVGPITAIVEGVKQAYSTTMAMVKGLLDLVSGRAAGDVGGPVAVMRITGEVAKTGGLAAVFGLAAFLSLNIGLLNLLPFPALDGARIVFLLWEGVRREKLNPAREAMVHYVGLVLLLMLMLAVTFKDISNWVMGQMPH